MNPLTNRKVSIYSKKGVSIIKHYLNQSGGVANNETRYLGPRSSAKTSPRESARDSDYFSDDDISSPHTRYMYISNILNSYQNNYLDPNDPIDIIIESCKNILKSSDSYFNMVDEHILSQKLIMILNLINTILDFQKGRGSQKILSLRRMRDELASLDYKQQD